MASALLLPLCASKLNHVEWYGSEKRLKVTQNLCRSLVEYCTKYYAAMLSVIV